LHFRITPNEINPKETFNARQRHVSFHSKTTETLEKGQPRVPFVLSRDTKGGVRGTRSRQPIEEERRTANQASPARCACTRSRVYGGIKEGAVALVRSLTTAKAGSQPKKSRYCAPPYRRLPVFGQSLPNSRRNPPSGTTPSLRRLDVEPRYQRAQGTRITQGRFLRKILPIARTRATRGAKEKW